MNQSLIRTNISDQQFIPYYVTDQTNPFGCIITVKTLSEEELFFRNYLKNCSLCMVTPNLNVEEIVPVQVSTAETPIVSLPIQISNLVTSIISRINLFKFDSHEITQTNENQILLFPKVESREKLEGDFEKIKYKNGVVDIMQPDSFYWSKYGRRIYPNGTVFKGTFEVQTNRFRRQDGYSIENGICIYYDPAFLGCRYGNRPQIGFAQVELTPSPMSEGSLGLTILKRTSDYGNEYVMANISPEEGLYKCPHQIFEVLNHPKAPTTIERFLDYLHQLDNIDNIPRILKLNSYVLEKIVNEAATKQLYIDFNLKNPFSQESLFSMFAAQGNARVTQYMLELDHRFIYNRNHEGYTALEKAIFNSHENEATIISQFMVKNDISFSYYEHWCWKAWRNETNFNQDDFRQLSLERKLTLFKIANIYDSEQFLEGILKIISLIEHHPFYIQKPLIIAQNMNAIQIRASLNQFFERLKKEDLILSKEAFEKLDRNAFVCKNTDIERLLGRQFILEAIETVGSTRIKVPKKILVPVNNSACFTIRVKQGRLLTHDFIVYAEKATPSSRSITRTEMKELVDVLEYICFNDFSYDNFFIAEDGIYFIDTEMSSFSTKPKYQQISELSHLLYRDGTKAIDSELIAQDIAWFENLMREKMAKAEGKAMTLELNPKKGVDDLRYLELFPCYHLQREFKFHF